MTKKKILFVIPSMQQGGAERVVSVMSCYWADKDNEVHILTFDSERSFFSLHPGVKIHSLNSAKKSFGIFNFLLNNISRTVNYFSYVKKIKPDIILSFTDNANVYCIVYNYLLRRPLIITQRTNPYFNVLPRAFKKFPALFYKSAQAIVVQTSQTLDIYRELNITLPKISAVIYNPLNSTIYQPANVTERKNIVLAVGRLYNKDKHYDRLIDIFNAAGNPDWELLITGEGPDRVILEQKIATLGIGERVSLPGSTGELATLYQTAKIFVLTSEFEGFPNALCEAMANGCACISYNCATGPSEIIHHRQNGLLIEPGNEAMFVTELRSLINDEERIQLYSAEAKKIRNLLKEEKIMGQWELLIEKVLEKK